MKEFFFKSSICCYIRVQNSGESCLEILWIGIFILEFFHILVALVVKLAVKKMITSTNNLFTINK